MALRESKVKTAATLLDQRELQSIKTVCAQLKASVPGIGQLLQNPNNMAFLMKFFQIMGERPDAFTLLRNSMVTIQQAMQKDQASTVAFIGKI